MKAKIENRALRMVGGVTTPERGASPGSADVSSAGGWYSRCNEPAGRQRSQERWKMVVGTPRRGVRTAQRAVPTFYFGFAGIFVR